MSPDVSVSQHRHPDGLLLPLALRLELVGSEPPANTGQPVRSIRHPDKEGGVLSGLHRSSWERWKADVVEPLTFKTDPSCCLSCKNPLTRRLMFSFLLPMIRAGSLGKSYLLPFPDLA